MDMNIILIISLHFLNINASQQYYVHTKFPLRIFSIFADIGSKFFSYTLPPGYVFHDAHNWRQNYSCAISRQHWSQPCSVASIKDINPASSKFTSTAIQSPLWAGHIRKPNNPLLQGLSTSY